MANLLYNQQLANKLGWKDIDINLNTDIAGDIKTLDDKEAIKSSLLNIVYTMRGSRRMLPEFGSGIYNQLMEPLDETTANNIGNILVQIIEYYESRIKILNLHVHINYDSQSYELTLTYQPINRDYHDSITFILKRI